MGVMKSNDRYLIHSVEKACDILTAFNENSLELGISELSQKLNLSKGTVHKLLITLEYKGLIVQNNTNGKYSLSVKIFELANSYLNKVNVTDTIRPFMESIARKWGETVHFAVLDGSEVVFIEKIEGTQSLNIYSKIGRRAPLHCVSVGKAILANLPQQDLQRILAEIKFTRHTSKTIVDHATLVSELEMIQKNSFALDNEEYEEGIKCVATPIRNAIGQLIGAVSVTGPIHRMTESKVQAIIPDLVRCSLEISRRLGNRRL